MARAPDPNIDLLIRVAEAQGGLRSRFVFVGGCATGRLITDPAAPAARPTRDVDVIVEVGALAEYREVRAAEPPLRDYLADVMRRTIADQRFRSVLGGFVIDDGGNPDRASGLLARLERLAGAVR